LLPGSFEQWCAHGAQRERMFAALPATVKVPVKCFNRFSHDYLREPKKEGRALSTRPAPVISNQAF
jgi:hypothetical protein